MSDRAAAHIWICGADARTEQRYRAWAASLPLAVSCMPWPEAQRRLQASSRTGWPDGLVAHRVAPSEVVLPRHLPVLLVVPTWPAGAWRHLPLHVTVVLDDADAAQERAFLQFVQRLPQTELHAEVNVRAMLRTSPWPLCLTALTDGRLVMANEAFRALVGLPEPGEPFSTRFVYASIWRPGDLTFVLDELRRRGEVSAYEAEVRTQQGGPRAVRVSVRVVAWADQLCLMTTFEDRTEAQTLYQRLVAERLREDAVLDALSTPLLHTDAEGRVLHVNAACSAWLGQAAASLVGQPISALLEADGQTHAQARLTAATWTSTLYHADGRALLARVDVRRLPRLKSDQWLYQLHPVVSPEPALAVSFPSERLFAVGLDRQGHIQFSSPALSALLGHAPDALLHTPWVDQVHPDDRVHVRALLAGEEGTSPSALILVRVRHVKGHWETLELAVSALHEEVLPHGVLMVGYAALDSAPGTPLLPEARAALQGPVDLIRDAVAVLTEDAHRHQQLLLGLIQEQATRLERAADHFVDVARVERGREGQVPERLDLVRLVQEQVAAMSAREVVLHTRVAHSYVHLDPYYTRHLVRGLLEVAAEEAPEVALSLRVEGAPQRVRLVVDAAAEPQQASGWRPPVASSWPRLERLARMVGGRLQRASTPVGPWTLTLPRQTPSVTVESASSQGWVPRAEGAARRVVVILDANPATSLPLRTLLSREVEVVVVVSSHALQTVLRRRPVEAVLVHVRASALAHALGVAQAARALGLVGPVRLLALTSYCGPAEHRLLEEAGFEACLERPFMHETLRAALQLPKTTGPD
ncbi:MAG: PAS domain-containing protein [Bacteroidota bacterium]